MAVWLGIERSGLPKLAAGFTVVMLFVAGVAVHADTLILKEEAFVKGPKLTLGDLADIQGDNADFLATIEIAPAPLPGGSKCIGAALVEARVENAIPEPIELEFKGARSVRATTRHLEITPEMVEEDLRQFILLEMPWDPADTDIDLTVPQHKFVVPDGQLALEWRSNPAYRYIGVGSFRGSLVVDGGVKKALICKAKVETYGDVVIATTDISRGKPITRKNVHTEKRALSALKDPVFCSPEEVLGFIARRTIFPGQVIKKRNVALPVLVKRNHMVIVETRVSGLHIQSQARAASDGAAGDVVRCVNFNSKQEFQGVVREDGVIVIP